MTTDDAFPTEQDVAENVSLRRFIYIGAAAILIQVSAGLITYLLLDKWEDRANFGDMFGAINTFFSGLAFAGVIYAILLQRHDLKLQRKELEMTREELKRAALAQEKSEQALVEQAKMMELTAKLTAVNFLAESYRNRIELLEKQGRESSLERQKWNEIMRSLEELTHLIEK